MNKFLFFLFSFLASASLFAQDASTPLSPYFQVKATADNSMETLPLRSTDANVNIAGVIADVLVTQVYENTGQVPIEAIYVFPGSSQSAVYGMRMKIGERIIEAEIQEKEAARATYEAAKQEGKRASLLEQERPNVFQMNVANIMPGDRVEVELRYTELLLPEAGIYQFVYPTVVGPRYTDGSENRNSGYTAMPYTTEGVAPSYDFTLQVYLDGGMPLQSVTSNTHDIAVRSARKDAVQIELLAEERKSADRDFILEYSFQGNEIQTGVLVYDDGDEQFFLCMAQPPKAVDADLVPPREYIFLMDVSGSMRGFPLSVSKSLMRQLIGRLRPVDAFNIMVFAGGNQWWSTASVSATPDNLQSAEQFLNTLSGGGGTSLLPALQQCLNFPRYRSDVSRSIVVVSDGYVSVEDEAFDLVRQNLNQANLFSFGIGSSVNRHLMEGLARAGQGQPFIVTDEVAAEEAATKLSRYIQNPLFTQIQTRFEGGFEAYDLEPLSLPDVLGERPVLLFGKFRGSPKGEIVLNGYTREAVVSKTGVWPFRKAEEAEVQSKRVDLRIDVSKAQHSDRNAALKYLWARERIRNLSDFRMHGLSEADQQETTRLSLAYNLLTNFTSFVAVEKEVSNEDPNKLVPVKQPLPLPQGVSNDAVGFELEIFGISSTKLLAGGKADQKAGVIIAVVLLIGLLLIASWKLSRRFFTLLLPVLGLSLASCSSEEIEVQPQPFSEVTFILGEDQGPRNSYFASALQYYSTDEQAHTPLVEKECRSLQEVMHYLEQHPPLPGPWETINLVVHGNEWTGINLPVYPDGPRCSPQTLQHLLASPDWESLPEELLNDCTTINVIGCNVGKNEALLADFRTVLAGERDNGPSLRSARHFNVFRKKDQTMKRYLAESCFVNFPAGGFPGNLYLAERLKEKYPNQQTDWRQALLHLTPSTQAPYVHYFNIPLNWMVLYPSEAARPSIDSIGEPMQWVSTQQDLQQTIQRMGFTTDSFRWKVSVSEFEGQPALMIEGQTIIYCVLHPFQQPQDQMQSEQFNEALYTIVP
ncbi:MAG: VIT domain-containing protein [Bacteroidota bacterium]